jgi:5-formyltetrahydrofolate cyclo-ligase
MLAQRGTFHRPCGTIQVSDSRQQPTGPTTGKASKAALRARLLAGRRALPEAARLSADLRIQAELTALVTALRAGRAGPLTVAGYVPFGTEPGGRDLPAVLARQLAGGRLLLPVLLPDRSLDWAGYDGRLLPRRGLLEPAGPRLGTTAIRQAALLVVPAVAVDRRGLRLGRGGGSYDRALALADPSAQVVALLHDGELLDIELPAEPHDRHVNAVITPARGLVRRDT